MPADQFGDGVISRIGVTIEYQCRYGVECLKGAGGTCLANVLVLPPKTYSG